MYYAPAAICRSLCQVDEEGALNCTCALDDACDSGKTPGSVKHQVVQDKESVDPGKSPLARCAVWTLHRKGASELCLQEYTLEKLSQSHELSPHRLQQNYSKSAFVTELIIAWFGQESHILHGSA